MSSQNVLAVLPFEISDLEKSYVLKNFGEDLANNFSKFQGINVLSYLSTQFLSLKDQNQLQKYGVTHIVTGTVRTTGQQFMLSVQLLSFTTGQIIFNEQFHFTESEVFNIQDQLVLQIVNILKEQLDQSILSLSYKKEDVELAAYEHYLRGTEFLAKSTPEDDQKARNYFEKALEKQPNFAKAYSGISSSYFNDWSCQLWERWEVSQKGARKYALKAIELDENNYQSLAILGRTFLYELEFDKAEYYVRKSLKMNPNDANNLLQCAFSLMFLGATQEAVDLYEKACSLNPFLKDKYLTYGATFYFEIGDYKKALDLGKKLDLNQVYVDFPMYMAAASHFLGHEEDTSFYWQQFLKKFKSHIYFQEQDDSVEALDWHIKINPYKQESKLKPFWEFISQKSGKLLQPDQIASQNVPTPMIRLSEGQVQMQFKNESATVKLSKGIYDLIRLLEQPHTPVHCTELMGVQHTQEQGVALLDAQAKKQIQRRMLSLQEELAEAESHQDFERATSLTTEYDELVEHLSKSLGLGGSLRKTNTAVDKSRAAVTQRIREAIKKIALKHESLAQHLNNSIKTGVLCSYRPENEQQWQILS